MAIQRTFIPLIVLSAFSGIAFSQSPAVTKWLFNRDEARGNSTDPTVHNAVDDIPADIQEVWYTATNAYIVSDSIPSHPIGPWTGGGPTYPTESNNTWVLPLEVPENPANVHSETPLGAIGVAVNGVHLFNWSDSTSYEDEDIWLYNAPAVRPLDAGLGHPSPGMMGPPKDVRHEHRWSHGPRHRHPAANRQIKLPPGEQAGGAYHYHTYPPLLAEQLGDDGTLHSPVMAWSFDGIPIYGAYGYSDPGDSGSGLKRLIPSWKLRDIVDRTSLADGTVLSSNLHGPPINPQNPLGTFAQDFEYVESFGDLDEFNGRFCVTPEYPMGTYAYFATIDEQGDPSWPYTVGPTYRSTPINANLGPMGGSVTIPAGATPYDPLTEEPQSVWALQ